MEGGYTMWARKTLDSDIFFSKPAEWFKIWFYLVNRVNWKEEGKFDRGSCFTSNEEIAEATGTSIDQVKRALVFMREAKMARTARSTRGMMIYVLNFAKYQDNSTYSRTAPRTRGALEAHHDSRRKEEGKNNTRPSASLGGSTSKGSEPDSSQGGGFSEFWEAYPRKVGRKDAERAFKKVPSTEYEALMYGLSVQSESDQWKKDGGRFIPHASTWLNGERWKDETGHKEAKTRTLTPTELNRLKELGYGT